MSLAAIVWLSVIPLPEAPALPKSEPGTNRVRLEEAQGLALVEKLGDIQAQHPEQQRRLKELARRARELREALSKGMPRREAQSKIAVLRDEILAERLDFADRDSRRGLEAAIHQLKNDPHLMDAAEALGNGDLTAFDRQMRELANRIEASDRQAAKQALDAAAQAAKKKGAQELAEALEEQQRLFERRAARAQALRELAKGLEGVLDAEGREALREFRDTGSADAERRLGAALEKALQGLGADERRRVAKNLRKALEQPELSMQPMSKEQLEKLAEQLETAEGQRELRERLKELAELDPAEAARRQRALQDAERGTAETERRLNGVPLPLPGAKGEAQNLPGGRSGGSEGSGQKGDHSGVTDEVSRPELRSKAEVRLDPTAPMQQSSLGRAAGGVAESANRLGTGALRNAAPHEVGAVERSEVPEEYREQVGRYFQP
jgi:hypothetical protein